MAKPSVYARSGSPGSGRGAGPHPARLPAVEAAPPGGALIGQIARFGATGLANVGVDLGVYAALLAAGAPIPAAKAVAFAAGTVFSYSANRIWTFRAGRGSAGKFAAVVALYAVSMAVNVGVNSLVIAALGADLGGKAVAYACALAVSAALNFIGMRRILLGPRAGALSAS